MYIVAATVDANVSSADLLRIGCEGDGFKRFMCEPNMDCATKKRNRGRLGAGRGHLGLHVTGQLEVYRAR
jgi:hypothetical protein